MSRRILVDETQLENDSFNQPFVAPCIVLSFSNYGDSLNPELDLQSW